MRGCRCSQLAPSQANGGGGRRAAAQRRSAPPPTQRHPMAEGWRELRQRARDDAGRSARPSTRESGRRRCSCRRGRVRTAAAGRGRQHRASVEIGASRAPTIHVSRLSSAGEQREQREHGECGRRARGRARRHAAAAEEGRSGRVARRPPRRHSARPGRRCRAPAPRSRRARRRRRVGSLTCACVPVGGQRARRHRHRSSPIGPARRLEQQQRQPVAAAVVVAVAELDVEDDTAPRARRCSRSVRARGPTRGRSTPAKLGGSVSSAVPAVKRALPPLPGAAAFRPRSDGQRISYVPPGASGSRRRDRQQALGRRRTSPAAPARAGRGRPARPCSPR